MTLDGVLWWGGAGKELSKRVKEIESLKADALEQKVVALRQVGGRSARPAYCSDPRGRGRGLCV